MFDWVLNVPLRLNVSSFWIMWKTIEYFVLFAKYSTEILRKGLIKIIESFLTV